MNQLLSRSEQLKAQAQFKSGKPDKLALIAGEGALPLHVARNAKAMGIDVIPFIVGAGGPGAFFCGGNREALKGICGHKPQAISPGLLGRTMDLLQQSGATNLVFAGKVNKWILLGDPRLDHLALEALRCMVTRSDDDIMLKLIQMLAEREIQVLPQTLFLENLFIPEKCLSQREPTESELADIRYGFRIAKEMGRLDVGQTVVVKDGMMIAIEAIEGTDECLKRAGRLARKKGGTVVKVAKPGQDQRFDVPTVGLRTLKTMKKYGLNVLATEANETLYLDIEEMTAFANQHEMALVSVNPSVGD